MKTPFAACLPSILRARFFAATFLCFASGLRADDYLGAGALLVKIEESRGKPAKPEEKPDEVKAIRAELKEFAKAAAGLPAAESARRWLELVDRAGKIKPAARRGFVPSSQPLSGGDLLEALPPPAAWVELGKAVAARPVAEAEKQDREIGLRLLVAALNGDTAGRKAQLAALQSRADKADPQNGYFYQSMFQGLNTVLMELSDDPDGILKNLEARLKGDPEDSMGDFEIPNLVALVGPGKAEAFLRKAMVRPGIQLEFRNANETSRLAQKLALELIEQMKTPQWSLVNSLDAVPLYEAINKKFGKEEEKEAEPKDPNAANNAPLTLRLNMHNEFGDYRRAQADVYFLLGLISQSRSKEAVAVAKRLGRGDSGGVSDEAYKSMERAGYVGALDDFFYELLTQDPGLKFWGMYVEIAAKAGQTERMVKLARASIARTELSKAQRTEVRSILFKALLAADQVEEGAAELRQLIAEMPADGPRTMVEDPGQLSIVFARMGILLNKPEWTEEGIKLAGKWLENSSVSEEMYGGGSRAIVLELADLLIELKRGPEAESALMSALMRALPDAAKGKQVRQARMGNDKARPILEKLVGLYYSAGRPQDVLKLLETAPWWGAKDLSELLGSDFDQFEYAIRYLHAPKSSLPLAYVAARALASAGRKEEAAKVMDALLERDPGSDRGYELLLELGGTNVLARLDSLFARDQFEERPLIWKAHVLLKGGMAAEAEKCARQAIAIDPSDGEEGPGDRMRAYAELADIREARGDKKEAEIYRGAVKAIRLSEQADKFYQAGLLKRAIRMYEESLGYFTDAYCIQSRLAIQLAAQGSMEEAEKHYRRAFELMPDSFGRVESHCFGCEKAFDGERAQNLAETVFSKMAVERPQKPQIQYLLGYLHEEEEHFNAAATNYRAAVKLDPDYLNAWLKLQGIRGNISMASSNRDEITFNLLRLDPRQCHANVDFRTVTDLAALWRAMDDSAKLQSKLPAALLPLPASKAEMEKIEKEAPSNEQQVFYRGMMHASRTESPAEAVAQTVFVNVAGQLITGNPMAFGSSFGFDQ